MARVFNFSAGPSMLPESVLREAAEEMLDYRGTGMSPAIRHSFTKPSPTSSSSC
mgnify:CR=1 FL=1